MNFTYEYVSEWFEHYFENVRKYQGNPKTVPNLKSHFTPDLELVMHTAPPFPLRMSRDELLLSFIHPGLQEDITPRQFVVDLKQVTVAVQFEINFRDEPLKKRWPPLQASAHYQLILDKNEILRIKRIDYWTQALPADLLEIWAKRREEALAKLALSCINAEP
jgi:hypothetical protein